MKQYKLKVDFLGFKKDTLLEYIINKNWYVIKNLALDDIVFGIDISLIKANPEIFEPVLCLEDELYRLLTEYARLNIQNQAVSTVEYRNKIIKLFEDRK